MSNQSTPPKVNIPELSVSELSTALKRTVEDSFSYIRVRGELSSVKLANSGHMYADLKDENAVLNLVCWRGTVNKLSIKPEEGLEVICTGRLSTYAGRSSYQMVVEGMEMAGEGALLKMLEDRKKKLAAEGLFDASLKKVLPFIPRKIGIVTSPTGAVIRDILHRLSDRFMRPVLLWPVRVQGETAANEVTAAIEGFNALPRDMRPDLLIVARGGGSLEDLMAFNEENVARAVAASHIPIISAIGHETDTTLIDLVADLRAPTPTGAAELAVPRKDELRAQILDLAKRLYGGMARLVHDKKTTLESNSKALQNPQRLLENKAQQFDMLAGRLGSAFEKGVLAKRTQLIEITGRLKHPKDKLREANIALTNIASNLYRAGKTLLDKPKSDMQSLSRMLESLSFERVLDRGYAVVFNADNQPVSNPERLKTGDEVSIQFSGKTRKTAVIGKGGNKNTTKSHTAKKTKKLTGQGELL